jgi:hypothetical protein
MQLSEINNTFQHRITDGSEYLWHCYGNNVRSIDYTSKYACGYVVFDTETQTVYEVSVSPVTGAWSIEPKPYRYINPEYQDAYKQEATSRGIDADHAWDDVKWIDLEMEEDFLEKATAIFNGEEFDTRVKIELDLDDRSILQLAVEAHKRDITLNNMIEIILQEVVDKHKVNGTLG